jgi:protein-tyrosine phosphatase
MDKDFERFDLLLAMDLENLEHLAARCPQTQQGRLALLLERGAPSLGIREVPDPYYGAAAGFERVLDLIEPACDGLVMQIHAALGGTS